MTKCIICFQEHQEIHGKDESSYCVPCGEIRAKHRNLISEIIPGLFLSSVKGARQFDGARLCVHEHPECYTGQGLHIPILAELPNSRLDRSGAVVDPITFDKAIDAIHDHQTRNVPLLVHCHAGIERSPLTVAGYFVKYKLAKSYYEAYQMIKAKRPCISHRTFWLSKKAYLEYIRDEIKG